MNIFGIGQNTSVDQIYSIQEQRKYNTSVSPIQSQGDRVSISQEALQMYQDSQLATNSNTQNTSTQFINAGEMQQNSISIDTKIKASNDTSLQNISTAPKQTELSEAEFLEFVKSSDFSENVVAYMKSIAIERQGDNDNDDLSSQALKNIGNSTGEVEAATSSAKNLDGEESNQENNGLSNSDGLSEEELAAAIAKAKQELEELTNNYEEIMSGNENIEEKFRLGQHVYEELEHKADEVASLEAQAKMQSVKAKGDMENMLVI